MGAVIGDHGGGGARLGGWRCRRVVKPPPRPRRVVTSAAIGIEQQKPIAAFHHVEAEPDQADCAVAQVVAFPAAP